MRLSPCEARPCIGGHKKRVPHSSRSEGWEGKNLAGKAKENSGARKSLQPIIDRHIVSHRHNHKPAIRGRKWNLPDKHIHRRKDPKRAGFVDAESHRGPERAYFPCQLDAARWPPSPGKSSAMCVARGIN